MQMLPHTGFIYYCDVVQKQAHEYRKKAARMVAAKCALAARVDSYYDERSKGATVGIGKHVYALLVRSALSWAASC